VTRAPIRQGLDSFFVRCRDMDATDHYRWARVPSEGDALAFLVSVTDQSLRAIPDDELVSPMRTRFAFSEPALKRGRGVMTLTQYNDVTHEEVVHERVDGVLRVRFQESTPPFLLSEELARGAREGSITGLRFFDFLGPMPVLRRVERVRVPIDVNGTRVEIEAERFSDASNDSELVVAHAIPAIGEASFVLSLSRDEELCVELVAIRTTSA